MTGTGVMIGDVAVTPGHAVPADPAGSKGATGPVRQPTRELTVTGGVGGTRAHLEDLYRAAGSLRAAADLLDQAQGALAAAWRATSSSRDPFGGCAEPQRAVIGPLLRSDVGPGAAAEEVRALARSLEEAARTYQHADGRAREALRTLVGIGVAGVVEGATALGGPMGGPVLAKLAGARMLLGAGGAALTFAVLSERMTGRRWDPTAAVRNGSAEVLVHGLGSYLLAAQPGVQRVDPHATGAALTPLAEGWSDPPLLVVPTIQRARALGPGQVPTGGGDVMRAIRDTYPDAGGVAGGVAVTRLDHPDGTRAWVVAIPGTETIALGSTNSHDNQSNIELLAGQVGASASRLVMEAMSLAGVGADEPVLLAGHSQGGMAAMVVAGAVAGTYSVTHVLTAGSPVAGLSTPRGVAVLNVEHSTDVVPALDGAPSPDTPERTTVVRELGAAQDPADRARADVLSAHDIDVYVRTMDLIDADGDEVSLRAWNESTRAQIFGPAGTTGSVQLYQGLQGISVPHLTAPGG